MRQTVEQMAGLGSNEIGIASSDFVDLDHPLSPYVSDIPASPSPESVPSVDMEIQSRISKRRKI